MADQATKRQKGEDSKPVIKFRNYAPTNEKLKDNILPAPDLPSIESEVSSKQELIAVSEKERKVVTDHTSKDVDILNLAPQKVDWDLKRDIAPKLEKLDRRTQRAINELLRAKK
eukprot:m.74791 g.74791  ORF g.74791 m.74791 type:complete len:114 (-) comp24700_c0_seq1:500-841(-)